MFNIFVICSVQSYIDTLAKCEVWLDRSRDIFRLYTLHSLKKRIILLAERRGSCLDVIFLAKLLRFKRCDTKRFGQQNVLTSRNNFAIVKSRIWKNFEGDVL